MLLGRSFRDAVKLRTPRARVVSLRADLPAAGGTICPHPEGRGGVALLTRGEQGGADRPAEVAERGEPDRGRARGGEDVRAHGGADALRVRLAELEAEAAADHHGLDVEHVAGGRGAGPPGAD